MDFNVIDPGDEAPDKKLILVADDELNLQTLIFDTLSDDHRLVMAGNGREAAEKAERLKPDLILMDVRMPDISGHEAVRTLQEKAATKNIPIIILSAVDFDPDTIHMIKNESNVKGFLTKPFRPAELRNLINKILKETAGII